MKIAITGVTNGFKEYYPDALIVSSRDGVDKVFEQVKDCDVFINHSYRGDFQANIFIKLFYYWESMDKTIVNFGSSIVHDDGHHFPVYAAAKKHLYHLSKDTALAHPRKRVRVINFNPSTLETNNKFNVQKLSYKELFEVMQFVINLPQDIEISELTIKKTTSENDSSLLI